MCVPVTLLAEENSVWCQPGPTEGVSQNHPVQNIGIQFQPGARLFQACPISGVTRLNIASRLLFHRVRFGERYLPAFPVTKAITRVHPGEGCSCGSRVTQGLDLRRLKTTFERMNSMKGRSRFTCQRLSGFSGAHWVGQESKGETEWNRIHDRRHLL